MSSKMEKKKNGEKEKTKRTLKMEYLSQPEPTGVGGILHCRGRKVKKGESTRLHRLFTKKKDRQGAFRRRAGGRENRKTREAFELKKGALSGK